MSTVAVRWMRTGLGAAVTQRPSTTAPARPPLPLQVQVQRDGTMVAQVAPDGLSLLGPGDVSAFDTRQVIGAWPSAEATGVSVADLVHIELADPALPWLVTPWGPDVAGNLTPWLSLVVVPDLMVRPAAESGVAVLDAPGDALPPWDQVHAWASVIITDPAVAATDQDAITAALRTRGSARARLICPLRLAGGTVYRACLVPVFQAGADALLGRVPIAASAAPAWSAGVPARLPIYWSFRFSTGDASTFEDLAMALRPPDDGDTGDVVVGGSRLLDVTEPGRSLPAGPPLPLGAALRTRQPPTGAAYDATRLRAEQRATNNVPVPTWGDWHAGEGPAGLAWLEELNSWPPHRVAAGLGAAAVRMYQEELMAAAWEQAGEVAEADEQLRHAQLALAVAQGLWRRRIAPLVAVPVALLQLAGPARERLPVTSESPRSLNGRIARSCLPPEVLHVPFRRIARPSGVLFRRTAHLRDGALSRSVLVTSYLDGLPDPSPDRGPESIRTPIGPLAGPVPAQPHVAAALAAWQASLSPPPGDCEQPDLSGLASATATALDPSTVLPLRVSTRISTAGTPVIPEHPGRPLSRLRVGPRIDVPMIDLLREQGTDWLLPGIGALPDDRILLAEPDPAFIEAFHVGAEHEISRELRFRRYRSSRGFSVFGQFWDRPTEGQPVRDVPDLSTWRGSLGSHLDPRARIGVLVARGALFRQYPDVRVYAHRAVSTPVGPRPAPTPDDTAWRAATQLPVLQARVPPGVRLFGFPQDAAMLRGGRGDPGWFIVLAERPVGGRFGVSDTRAAEMRSWADLSWDDLTLVGGHLDATAAPSRAPATGPAWSSRSDVLPAILRRPPFRLFVHATRLLPTT